MAWIESHTVLSRHRKLAELAAALRIRRSYAMGHLHSLWHAALEQQEDGDLSSWSDEFIAESSDFPGDAPQFVRLLQQHRWLDGRLLHDWIDYAGLYLIRKYSTSGKDRLVEIWLKHGREYGANGKRTNSEQLPLAPNRTLPERITKPEERVAVGDLRAREGPEPAAGAATPAESFGGDSEPPKPVPKRPERLDGPPKLEGVVGTNKPTIESALAWFKFVNRTQDERFAPEEIREAYRQFEASQDREGNWKWGVRLVGDWRAAMAQRMHDNRERRGGKKPAATAGDAILRSINGVRVNKAHVEND